MKTKTFSFTCLQCGTRNHIPYIPPLKQMTEAEREDERNREASEALIEVAYTVHKISYEEYEEYMELIKLISGEGRAKALAKLHDFAVAHALRFRMEFSEVEGANWEIFLEGAGEGEGFHSGKHNKSLSEAIENVLLEAKNYYNLCSHR